MIYLNPEFHRNLWLNFSPFRLFAMPVVSGIVLMIVSNTSDDWKADIFTPAISIYFLVIFLWGNYAAASALHDEVKNNTWDFQKMSSIGPWQLALGKLFGTTSYVWYLALPFLIMAVYSYVYQHGSAEGAPADPRFGPPAATFAAYMILAGAMGHAAALFAGLINFRYLKTNVIAPFIFGFFISATVYSLTSAAQLYTPGGQREVTWHGLILDAQVFTVSSLLFFFFWILTGIHRLLREELQFRNSPLVWLAFVITMTLYFAGFTGSLLAIFPYLSGEELMSAKLLQSFMLVLFFTYIAGFTDAMNLARYRRWLLSARAKQWRRVFEDMPGWLASTVLIAPLFVLANLYAPRTMNDPDGSGFHVLSFTVSAILFVARDGAMVHAMLLGDRLRHSRFVLIFYYLMMYVLLPFLSFAIFDDLDAGGQSGKARTNQIIMIFYPAGIGGFFAACGPIFIQALFAGFLLYRAARSLTAPARPYL